MSKVMIVNGSARTENGDTAFLLKPLVEGMKKAGAKVEMLYPKRQKILPCTGCFKCWYDTIGKCFIKDNMESIYPKLREIDTLVLATPVYIPLPGMIQNFINRLCPLIEPQLEYKDGRTRTKFHDDVNISKIVGLVTGGWWEIENLNIVVKIIEELAMNSSTEFFGPILRPHAYLLREKTGRNQKILETVENMGEMFIKEGKFNRKDLKVVSQPLVNKEDYLEVMNKNYFEAKVK